MAASKVVYAIDKLQRVIDQCDKSQVVAFKSMEDWCVLRLTLSEFFRLVNLNGLKYSVVPTKGGNIHRAMFRGVRIEVFVEVPEGELGVTV